MDKIAKKVEVGWTNWIDKNEKKGKGEGAKELYRTYVETMKNLGEPVYIKLPGLYQE